jgi:hypothetical protein
MTAFESRIFPMNSRKSTLGRRLPQGMAVVAGAFAVQPGIARAQ